MKTLMLMMIAVLGMAIIACENKTEVKVSVVTSQEPINKWVITTIRASNTGKLAYYTLRSIPSKEETPRIIYMCDSIGFANVGDTLKLQHIK